MMDDSSDSTPPEVTIEPADNGFVVRHHQRSDKKDTPGRTIRRVASTTDEALGHAKMALSGGGKSKTDKKKSARGLGAAVEGAIGEHAPHSVSSRSRARRRPRSSGRR